MQELKEIEQARAGFDKEDVKLTEPLGNTDPGGLIIQVDDSNDSLKSFT